MNRRAFIYNLGLGLAAGWVASRLSWPRWVQASTPPVSLALLADAHLYDGDPGRPEALSLARAVAEIKALPTPPHLVLFAGDLAHNGHPHALALGEEILWDLPMPVLAVRGEGDGRTSNHGAAGKLFRQDRFVYSFEGINLLGVDTVWQDTSEGPAFVLGEVQHRWLNLVLAGLDPDTPLVVLSHAPLTPIFRPWDQWILDSGPLLSRLAQFRKVVCLHGHVHQGSSVEEVLEVSFGPYRKLQTENRKPITDLALPATSWPLPQAQTGTPHKLRPGLGPRGCGWALLYPQGSASRFYQVAWQD